MATAVAQLEHCMLLSGTKAGVLYFAGQTGSEYEMTTHNIPHDHGIIHIIGPANAG
jgi:hypothetical protein